MNDDQVLAAFTHGLISVDEARHMLGVDTALSYPQKIWKPGGQPKLVDQEFKGAK